MNARIHETREANQDGGQSDQAVKHGDQFRHLRHLNALRQDQADASTDEKSYQQGRVVSRDDAKERCQQRDRHACHAIPVTAARRLWVGEATQGQNE